MKLIPLTQGKFAMVDDDDYDRLAVHKWYAIGNSSGAWYARRAVYSNNKQTIISMHSAVIGKREGFITDHKNRNGLDNQKSNLRFCSPSQNMCNKTRSKNGSSKYLGVIKHGRRWQAAIKGKFIGSFETEDEAGMAYNEAASRIHGEFAALNIIK